MESTKGQKNMMLLCVTNPVISAIIPKSRNILRPRPVEYYVVLRSSVYNLQKIRWHVTKKTKTLFLQIFGHAAFIKQKVRWLYNLHDIHFSLTKASALI